MGASIVRNSIKKYFTYFPATATDPSGGRDNRIDFFRGLALLCIFVDHIPGNIASRFTLHNMGFSDASELFVLLAGISAALAYGKSFNCYEAIIKRAGIIYIAHIVLVLMIASMLAVSGWLTGNATLASHATLAPFAQDPRSAILNTILLTLQPQYIDILPLYLTLLLWLPFSLRLSKSQPILALSIATTIWFVASLGQLNFPAIRHDGWYFNPLAWQLLFNIGIVLGMRDATRGDQPRLPRSKLIQFLTCSFLLFSLILSAPWKQLPLPALRELYWLPVDLVGYVSKTYASPWRIAHILCLAYVTACWVPRDAAWLGSPWSRLIQRLGRQSLAVFMLASVCSYASYIVFVIFGRTLLVQFICNLIGLGFLIFVGNLRLKNANQKLTLRPRLPRSFLTEAIKRKFPNILNRIRPLKNNRI
jgi:hypothetical protein